MAIPASSPMLLTRNLLYTGITRAKKLLIIIGSEKIIQYMIQNIDTKKRNTGLEHKLRELRKNPENSKKHQKRIKF
ncbi:MAG: ATP-binding domain-containing protein [Clostridia bacterium]|nr:ATP-binding domain-containing protein [Clostridia bacterium]